MNICTDCGSHFRSGELLKFLSDEARTKNVQINMNFFAEYHGKSVVDCHFGDLSRVFIEIIKDTEIKNAKDLKEAFENKIRERGSENIYFWTY